LGECGVGVHNLGPDPASNVVVRISSSPSGLVFMTDETSAGSYVPTTQQWTIGSMLPNSSASLRCSLAVFGYTFQQNFVIAILARSDAADPNPDNNNVFFHTAYTP
jgi:hypothetical protein